MFSGVGHPGLVSLIHAKAPLAATLLVVAQPGQLVSHHVRQLVSKIPAETARSIP